ncbi:MAG: CHAT domain-containing protein [Microcystis aeruginosa Ma_QC_C_20070703_M131]|uniref:CHAT domain-containing protein n=1 Tax=Microcystis aeruginosa Ma_QC_C_20070703_M131 TaxID=2486263 RepID=A0A551Y397_MICAE|nr:MAG: CHAT domain-containing protein [Microcystis aeruginosa Ma_QC_C_20070703_M131]
MNKSVIINLGSGDLYQGFPRVTVQLWTDGNPRPEQFIGTLPPAPALGELYRNWQLVYRGLCDRLGRSETERITGGQRHPIISQPGHLSSASLVEVGELEISEAGITNISEVSFDELCQQLQASINTWLKSEGFLPIELQLRSRLDSSAPIRVMIETNDLELRSLPWHRWHFFEDYPQAEMALSQPEYHYRNVLKSAKTDQKVRILAVLGNSSGIDLATETRLLQRLQDGSVKFLVNPSRQEFNTQLWQPEGWDILFFAGHSQTQGQTGRIYINENSTHNSLTISQLEEALKTAIEKGLKLAIFNSCDGLGLAQALEKLHIPTVIVMREPIPNRVAQEFFQQFLTAFALEQLPLYLAVQQARRKLQGLEDDFPAASWLPVICQNLAVEPPTWIQLGGTPTCPYRGLFAFREEDARFFFGREQVTQALLAAVKQKPLVAVIGASGSGKSSVVFAGLVPRLRQELGSSGMKEQGSPSVQIVSFRPGNNPLEALATGLAQCPAIAQFVSLHQPQQGCGDALPEGQSDSFANAVELERLLRQDDQGLSHLIEWVKQQNSGMRLILIADQFEELYTLCPESERQTFLDTVLNAVNSAPAFTLILTLRADFCGYALAYRPLSDALQGAIQVLGPMNREELPAAIAKPAAQMQVKLEDGLIQKLIHAMNEQPGRLPLLEFALTQLWSNQRDGWLTNQAYDQIGGVEAALANHAEFVYAQLNEEDRQRSQRVFIQLVQPGAGTDDSRRTATQEDVQPENWDLVARLASSRLVVTNRNDSTGEETVEIVHEALIGGWKRLRNWMQLDREFRLWQEQLRANRYQWERSHQDEGALLRGKPLTDAEYWYLNRADELSSSDCELIEQSVALRDRDLKSQKRRRKLTISGLTGGLLGALILAGVAWGQWQNSARSEIQAITASSEALFVSNNKLDALIEAIRAWQKLSRTGGTDAETKTQVDSVLRQAVYGVLEYNRLLGHGDEVKSVAFSPDGNTIASAAGDKTIKLWKQDGTIIATLNGHSDKIWQAVFSPDGQTIASASKDKTIKLWRIEAGKIPILITTLVGHHHDVRGVAFSPDGQMLASASDDKMVKLWKRDGTLITTLAGHSDVVNGVAFSPDGQMLASASDDKTVKLWKRDGTLITTLKGHTDIVNGVAFSPDGQLLASASWDKTIKLWKLETGKMPTLLTTLTGHSEVVYGVAFSPDSQTLASGSWDKTVKLWKRDGTPITTLNGHSDRVWGVAFSSDGENLASASGDKTVKLWRLKSPLMTRLAGHTAVVIGVAFSPDGKTIASASDDKKIRLWKRDGTLIASLVGHTAQVYGVAFSPDGQRLASVSADNTVKLWKLGPRKPQLLATLRGHQAVVWGVAFSPDGQTVASAAWDNTVKLWNVGQKTPQLLATLRGHQGAIFGVAFSPDSKTLASASADNTVKLWRVKPAQIPVLLRTLTGHTAQIYSVAFSPDGQTIASASADNTIELWKPDGTLLTTLKGHGAVVYSVAFSPDGQTIASASWDKTIKLWKPDGTLLTTLNGYSDRFWGIAFSPDGQTIASANEDKTVILWNKEQVLTLNPLMYGCNWVHDYLKTNPNVNESDRHLCD